jgi:protein-S-isoprenylcysteine O-methyltransferase Ste14
MRALENTKFYDLAMATPLIGFYVWNIYRAWPGLSQNYYILRYGYADPAIIASTIAQLAAQIFAAVLIVLLLLRPAPKAKSGSLLPRVTAVAGTFAALLFLYLPPAAISAELAILCSILIFLGLGLTTYALLYLGRSFSIMPEARRLVTGGPYALARHPVYVFEEIAVLGIMLQYAQPWASVLFIVHIGLQMARASFEEKVLASAFPEYRAYAAKTARFIPGVY